MLFNSARKIGTFALLAVMAGCEGFLYTARLEVPFEGPPRIAAGDPVINDKTVIGRVAGVLTSTDGARVLVDVKPRTLPDRAAFLATTDEAGHQCLQVYAVPTGAHPSRGPYWGARNKAELAVQLGRGQAQRAWSGAWDWILGTLGARETARRDDK